MTPASTDSEILRFGVFELDRRRAELRKAGLTVKLPPQPFKILELLAARPGELISRDDLRREVWGDETFVDFDRSLNVCITQIRSVLNDSAESPRFIQTVPRRGYRFLASVEPPVRLPVAPEKAKPDFRPWILLGIFLAITLLGVGLWRAAGPGSERTRLAILPFTTIGDSSLSEASMEGLTDDLITQAGMLAPSKLGVIARASVLRFRGKSASIPEIARELNVAYVLEGSIQAGGHVNARLIRVSDQTQVWSATLELNDAAPRILSGLSQSIAGTATPPARLEIRSPDALAAYRDGRYFLHQETREGLSRAVERFDDSIRAEPSAAAYTGLADALVVQARSGAAKAADVYPKAEEAARQALRLRDGEPEAHNALANTLFWFDWNWQESERHFRRALTLNPSFAAAHHDYAWLLIASGRTLDGLRELDAALSLDPLSRRVNIDAGWLLLQARRYPEAEAQARRALALEPGLPEGASCLNRALIMQGKIKAPAFDPARAGLFEQAKQYASSGDKENAIASLKRAVDTHNAVAVLMKSEPAFDSLHADPRFQELVRRVRIP